MAKTPPFSVCNEFCVGGGGASDAKNVKYDNTNSGLEADNVGSAIDEIYKIAATNPDWNQNDSTQPDYIKNRIAYDERIGIGSESTTKASLYVEAVEPFLANQLYECEVREYYDQDKQADGIVADSYSFRFETDDEGCSQYGVTVGKPYFETSTSEYACGDITIYKIVPVTIEDRYIPDSVARTEDVEEILDELHAYAQTLIGGEA